MKINNIVKALIIVDVIFCLVSFTLMGLNILNITSGDIVKVASVIMSPEVLVGINKMFEKFNNTEDNTEEKESSTDESSKNINSDSNS